ncbi:MAG: FtsX-like permease family protein [Bacteroidota bacterium]
MIAKTNLKVSLSHLGPRIKQTMVAVLSVTFGISMYIFMNGFMSGVNTTQNDLAFSTLAHLRIFNDLPEDRSNLLENESKGVKANVRSPKVIQYTKGIRNSNTIIQTVNQNSEVIGVTPQVNVNVIFRKGATHVNGVLAGVDIKNEHQLFETGKYVIEGNWFELQYRGDGLILGVGLAERLGVVVNDNINVFTSDGIDRNFKVIGLLKTTISGVDNAKAYLRINTTRQLISQNQSYVTDIQVNVRDMNSANAVAESIATKVDYKVESWMESSGQLQAGAELRDIIAIAVSLTILLVAGFGIYNIMNMTVNEKIKEIAILKAMGFEGVDIVQIFLVQSVVIGMIGGFVGMIFGYLVSVIINQLPFEIGSLSHLPMDYNPKDYAMAFLFGLITTFTAGYLPAKKASKVDPVEIIRG